MTKILSALLLLTSASVSTAGQYDITDLGTLGGSDSSAYGINNQGQVVGAAEMSGNTEFAFVWEDGVMVNIESWSGFSSDMSLAVEVNDNRIVVGTRSFFSDVGFAAADGAFLFSTTGSGNQYVRDINNFDQLLVRAGGQASVVDLTTGQTTNLGNMSGVALNDLGQITGGSFFWDDGDFTPLGDLGHCCTTANDLNNAGQVVGWSNYRAGFQNPFVWDIDNGIVDLGTLGGSIGGAYAINELGDIVGVSYNSDSRLRATVWKNGGAATYLGSIVNDLSGWEYLFEARDINEQGQIVGIGYLDTGERRAFLLTPSDNDVDTVGDHVDNCLNHANTDQRDTNGDGFGNTCDPDLTNDGIVNFADLAIMRTVFFTDDADADFNGDNFVNFLDLAVMREFFFLAPGPSALVP